MSRTICIFEDGAFADFFPLSLSQPLFDLRIGVGTLRDRFRDLDPRAHFTLLCRDYLADVVRAGAPDIAVNPAVNSDTLFINACWLCFGDERNETLARVTQGVVAVHNDRVVAARLDAKDAAGFAAVLRAQLSDAAVDATCARLQAAAGESGAVPDAQNPAAAGVEAWIAASGVRRLEVADARVLAYPWNLIEHSVACIEDDFARASTAGVAADAIVHPSAHIVHPERVAIGSKAVIRAGAVIDATDGPVIVGAGAIVMPNATVVGPASIGADSVVKAGARLLSGTSVGRVCKVGGEVDETIFADYSNKQHDGFLGHAYVGSWVNIGAATNNSDLKNTYGAVRMWNAGRARDTGRQFLGVILGDHSKTGINAVFNTGTVVGFNCNLYSSEMPDAFVPSFSWGHGREVVPYDLEKAIQIAVVVMQRRGVTFTDSHHRLFQRLHDMVTKSGRNA